MILDDAEARVRSWFHDGHKLVVYSKGKYDCKLGTMPRGQQESPGSIVIDIRMHAHSRLRRVDSISVYYRCIDWGNAYIFAASWKGHECRIYRISPVIWEVRVFVTRDQFEIPRTQMTFPAFS